MKPFVSPSIRFATFATLALVSFGAAASNWAPLNAKTSNPRIFVERESAQKGVRTHSVKVWFMLDYDTPQGQGDQKYMSLKAQTEYDCDLDQSKFITQTTYTGTYGRGSVVATSPVATPAWKPVAAKSIGAIILSDVCRR